MRNVPAYCYWQVGPACLGPCVPLGVLPPFSSHSPFAKGEGVGTSPDSSVMCEIILLTSFYISVGKPM